MPDGTKLYGKQILNDPEKYFTEDIMDALEVAADKEFSYGKGTEETGEEDADSTV